MRTLEDVPSKNIKLSFDQRDVTSTSVKVRWSKVSSQYWRGPQKHYLVRMRSLLIFMQIFEQQWAYFVMRPKITKRLNALICFAFKFQVSFAFGKSKKAI